MNDTQTLIIVIAVLILVGIILAVVLPLLKKRGIDMGAVLDRAKDSLDTVNKTLDMLKPFMEDSPVVDAFDKILNAATVGVGQAEQLHLIGQLEPEERKDAARRYVIDAVKLMGVEVTPEVSKLIDGAIEAQVLELGHKVDLSELGIVSEPLIPVSVAQSLLKGEEAPAEE